MIIDWINKTPFKQTTKLKLVNFVYALTLTSKTAYWEIDVSNSEAAHFEIKDALSKFKNAGHNYATCYEIFGTEFGRIEKRDKIIIQGWERVVRATWDEL